MRMESFIKFPRGLLERPEFSGMSVEAKLLFALILDRTGVSEMNSGRFTDKQGNLFVIYTLDEICGKLGCSKPTAVKVLKELQEREMIEKKREGAGKASKIIVKKSALSVLKILPDSSKKFNPSGKENEPDEVKNSDPIYNKENYNNLSYTHSSTYEELTERIEDQIEYDCIMGDAEIVREIIYVIADVMTGLSPTVKIGSEAFPREVVISRYKKLTAEHIQYVVNCIENAETKIVNMKGYLVAALFNAPATMASADAADIAYYQYKKNNS
ncbi:MAG: replication initiator protein A [Clostridia bacterium]|nr:replication initiator protein A [Clostridia bacterium]